MKSSYSKLLKTKGVKRLLSLISFVSFAEFFLESLIYIWIVSSTSTNQALQVVLLGFYVACSTIPRIIGAALLGVAADRIGARRSFIVSSLSRSVICLFMVTMFGVTEKSNIILIVVMLVGVTAFSTLNQLFLSARAQAIQELVPKPLRATAASFSMVLLTGISITSSAVAPSLFEVAGIVPCLLIVLIALIFATILSYASPYKGLVHHTPQSTTQIHKFFVELKDGWDACWKVPYLRMVLIGSVCYGIPMGINNISLILLWVEQKQASFSQFGMASALFGAGGLVGSLVSSLVAKKISNNRTYILSLIALGAIYFALSYVNNLPFSFALMFIGGLFFSIFAVLQSPILLNSSPKELTGRVVSTTNAATALSSLIAAMCISGLFAILPFGSIMYSHAVALGGALVMFGGLLLGKSIFQPKENFALKQSR